TSTSAGQINFNGPSQTVTFNAGSKYTWDLAALTDATNQAGIGYDQIGTQNGPGLNLTNGVVELAFSGATTPTTANPFWLLSHQWTILQVGGSVNTSQFGGISNANVFSSVGTFSLSLVGATGNVTLSFAPVITPEPTFILSVGMAGLGLLWRFRRRSQS